MGRGGYRYILEECPWNGHTDGSAYIVRGRDGWIAAGCHHNSCQEYGCREMRGYYEPEYPDTRPVEEDLGADRDTSRELSQTDTLVAYVDGFELFHAPEQEAYATFDVDGHSETWAVESRRFELYLRRRYFEDYGRAPKAQPVKDAVATIAARAIFSGPERRVFARLAGHEGAVYIDLCNERWEAVEITPEGWRVVARP